MTTARMSPHARDRCQEMGIRTRVAKRIVANPDVSYESEGRVLAASDAYPGITVVYAPESPPVVVTVVWRTPERWERAT